MSSALYELSFLRVFQFREFEQQRELSERGSLTASERNSRNESVTGRLASPGDAVSDHVVCFCLQYFYLLILF